MARPRGIVVIAGVLLLAVAGCKSCFRDRGSRPVDASTEERDAPARPLTEPAPPSADEIARLTTPLVAAQLAGGFRTTCARVGEERVDCWGHGGLGTLGDATGIDHRYPVSALGLRDVVDVAAAMSSACAVVRDGGVVCWGSHGTTRTEDYVPARVDGVTLAVRVGVGDGLACALRRDARVVCWARTYGLGASTPAVVEGLPAAVEIGVGSRYACARAEDGKVRCWGRNDAGQAGAPSMHDVKTPGVVAGLDDLDVVGLAVGPQHACALGRAGSVRCWGQNTFGQLGDGSRASRGDARPVSGVTDAIAIGLGHLRTCAVRREGAIACWGVADGDPELGVWQATSRPPPGPARPPRDELRVAGAAEVVAGSEDTCVRRSDGHVLCWRPGGEATPVRVFRPETPPLARARLEGALAVDGVGVADGHTCALGRSGIVYCRGDNSNGQCGDQGEGGSVTLGGVPGLPRRAVEVAVGGQHSCARLESGAVYCWGQAGRGQLGPGRAAGDTIRVPVEMKLPGPARAIVAGGFTTCAFVASDVVCWGSDDHRYIGRPPTVYPSLRGATQLALASYGGCARLASGAAGCWGTSGLGGAFAAANEASRGLDDPLFVIPGLGGVEEVRTGDGHACARLADGSVQCWGADDHGQLGDEKLDDTPHGPVRVSGVIGAVELACTAGRYGDSACYARLRDGRVVSWGGRARVYSAMDRDGDAPPVRHPLGSIPVLYGTSHVEGGGGVCGVFPDASLRCFRNASPTEIELTRRPGAS